MSALGIPVLINSDRAYWLSSIGSDVIHSTIQVQEIDASIGRFSTIDAGVVNASSFNVSTLGAQNFDVSGMYVSTIRGNTAFFSTVTLASDLSGGVGYVRFSVDASGIQVDGDPIRFDNLVYLTSTINIVQVSTIVDTDIFAQNGYFSTLSTGSLSSGVANINQASISSLAVSSITAGDISGYKPQTWSLYPTLNSSITFQPGNVLSNVGTKLFFAGTELTDVSGGGANWSLFPAISTVNMSNNLLINLSSVKFQDGGTLTSLTGNNLQYNGLPIQYGNGSNITQWASYPAVSSVNMSNFNLSNAALFSGSNLNLTGSNVTNGNTWTGTLAVGGTTLTPLATISAGDLTCRNINVGDPVTSLADVNIYGATALPGDNALYVEGGTTLDGGTIHGFTAGVIPVAGINTGRIDMLQAGFNLLHPLVGAITTGAALGITAGGALSLAGGGYVEMNTSTLQMINTSQGNKNTTIQAGFLTIDPDLGATSSIKLFNTLGGGVEIDGGGQGSLTGFSTVRGANLSTINLQVSTINGVPLSSIQVPQNIDCSNIRVTGNISCAQSTITNVFVAANRATASTILWNLALGVSTVSADHFGQRLWVTDSIIATTNLPPIDARIIGFSTIQGGQLSCINLQCSTINGLVPGSGGGATSNYNFLYASTLQGTNNPGLQGSTINVNANIQFVGQGPGGPNSGHQISSLRQINSIGENLEAQASTIFLSYLGGINPNGNIRLGSGGAFDTYIKGPSTIVSSIVMAANELYTSTVKANGGLPVKFTNGIQFSPTGYLDFVQAINLSPSAIPDFQIGGSTITLVGENVKLTGSLSTNSLSTGALSIGDINAATGYIPQFSSIITSFSTIQNVNPAAPAGLSSLVNVAMLYNGCNYPYYTGLTIENYINEVDNLDIGLSGNNNGSYIYSYGQNRSTLTNMFFKGNQINMNVADGLIVAPTGAGQFTQIYPSYISTFYINGLSSINDFNPEPAFTNNLQLSTMNLYPGSTTLLCWSTITTNSNINTTNYDTVVGLNGTYKFGISLQMNNQSGSDTVEYFFLKNGAPIPFTGSIHTVPNNELTIVYSEILEKCANGDNIQVGLFTNSSDLICSTIQGNVEISPGAIFTAYKVGS